LFPPRDSYIHYVEPFFGGGAVLFEHNPEGKSEVVNDIYEELVNFWRHLADENSFKMLIRKLEATPIAFDMWVQSFAERFHPERWTPLDRAAQFFIRYRQSRQGLGDCFNTLSRNRVRRGMNEQASAWLSAVEGLPAAHERLKRVVVLHGDAMDVIRQQDGAKTLFYCDPPYLHDTRSVVDAYEHEMLVSQHGDLLTALANIQGKFVLSGYRSALYDGVAETMNWRRVDIEIPNHSSGAKVKEIETECLWMNYQP
jgi:DNA adenine methylase